MEVALAIERPAADAGAQHPQAMLLCRAPAARAAWVDAVAGVARELEVLAGVRPREQLQVRPPLALPGLDPVPPVGVMRQLEVASRRGLDTPWHHAPVDARARELWQAGPGAVLSCWDGTDWSAQAVVALHGRGDPRLLAPRPGGAVLVRAWRVGRVWGVVCAVVLGATGALGLGREASRLAAAAGEACWQASVPRGGDAVAVARAGDPRRPIPLGAARRASEDELRALFASCLAVGLAPPPAGRSFPDPVRPSPGDRRDRPARLLDDVDGSPGSGSA